MAVLIEAINLGKQYRKGETAVAALAGVSFAVEAGEFISLVGRSGSGKSTLLNIIGGLDNATTGQIKVRGRDLTVMDQESLAQHRRNTVGMIFQSFNLIPSRTAVENVELPMVFAGESGKRRKEQALRMLERVGLGARTHHTPAQLSGGQQQRVAIARALMNNPPVLLADEPTGNLDSRTAVEILDLLFQLNQQHSLTILMVTHDEPAAARLSHRMLHMLDGEILQEQELRRMA
ncbi:MAG: ABC transporter ATP-binding protein YtrE [bacterium ADurb.Bin478]|nr:MAG: ABC transporter ATP-binding protein YtrE [bacterium ADurb.Bin478]